MSLPIERVLAQSKGLSDEDLLSMVLANRIDHGGKSGGLISIKQFPALISDIKAWRAWANAHGGEHGDAPTG